MFRDKFGFAEHQEKATTGLGYKLVLTRNIGHSVLNKDNATNLGNINFNVFEWYVPQFKPSIPQQSIISKQISCKVPTDLQYVEGCVFGKKWILQTFGVLN